MAATSAERIVYASKSKKWNSTQNNKFPIEFPTEHTANLNWIRQVDEENARRAEEETRAKEELQRKGGGGRGLQNGLKGKNDGANGAGGAGGDGRAKWIVLGVVGFIIAVRAWQRYRENTL